jgi:GNAT superfamily N-acetyltransferase
MGYELKPVVSREDWQHLHAIRLAVLFAPGRHPGIEYDDNHPDDHRHNHIPYLFELDGTPIGVVRLDRLFDIGTVRLVAIVTERQRQGHGRVMEAMVADAARRQGIQLLRVNAAAEAVGFYERTGWRKDVWDVNELRGIARGCVQMVKDI